MQDQINNFQWIMDFLNGYGIDGLVILAIIGATEFVKAVTRKNSKLYALLPLFLGVGAGLATTKEWAFGSLYMASLKYAGTAMILYLVWSVAFDPARKWLVNKFRTPSAKKTSAS